jgi:hypothetical protein
VRQFLGDDHGGAVEVLVGHDEVDDVPPLERAGRVAPPEQCHLFGPGGAGPLGEPLHRAHQRVEADGDLDRADLG